MLKTIILRSISSLYAKSKEIFGIALENVKTFGIQVGKSLSSGVSILWEITTNNVSYYGGKIVAFGSAGIKAGISAGIITGVAGLAGLAVTIGSALAVVSNSLGVISYCFIKIVEKGVYTLKTASIILLAIFNPVTQIGKDPAKVVIWIFKLGFQIITLGLFRKYHQDLGKRLKDVVRPAAEFEGAIGLPPEEPPPAPPPAPPDKQQHHHHHTHTHTLTHAVELLQKDLELFVFLH